MALVAVPDGFIFHPGHPANKVRQTGLKAANSGLLTVYFDPAGASLRLHPAAPLVASDHELCDLLGGSFCCPIKGL